MKSPHHLLRLHSSFGTPFEEITIEVHDRVKLKGTWLRRGNSKVVILLNAFMRSRHQFGMVLLAEWLAASFDVLCVDARGHFGSGGFWEASEAAVRDVANLVEFARKQGYSQIGLCGRSIGAWACIMAAAMFNVSDSVVAIAPPTTKVLLRPALQPFARLALSPYGVALRILAQLALNVRIGSKTQEELSLTNSIGNVAPVPLLLIFHRWDPVLGIGSDEAHRIHDIAREPKKLIVIENEGHGLELESFREIALATDYWFRDTLA